MTSFDTNFKALNELPWCDRYLTEWGGTTNDPWSDPKRAFCVEHTMRHTGVYYQLHIPALGIAYAIGGEEHYRENHMIDFSKYRFDTPLARATYAAEVMGGRESHCLVVHKYILAQELINRLQAIIDNDKKNEELIDGLYALWPQVGDDDSDDELDNRVELPQHNGSTFENDASEHSSSSEDMIQHDVERVVVDDDDEDGDESITY